MDGSTRQLIGCITTFGFEPDGLEIDKTTKMQNANYFQNINRRLLTHLSVSIETGLTQIMILSTFHNPNTSKTLTATDDGLTIGRSDNDRQRELRQTRKPSSPLWYDQQQHHSDDLIHLQARWAQQMHVSKQTGFGTTCPVFSFDNLNPDTPIPHTP